MATPALEAKIAEAQRLLDEGADRDAITEALGVTLRTVERWGFNLSRLPRPCIQCGEEFQPTHGKQEACSEECARKRHSARKRLSADAHRAYCPDCGDPLAAGSEWKGWIRCKDCCLAHEKARTEEKWARIEALWADGLSMREIAKELGTTPATIGVTINGMRHAGRSVPYRHDGYGRFTRRMAEAS